MKTAISIDDATFGRAEMLAQRLGLSRSELYRAALAEYLRAHDEGAVTEALDRVYRQLDSQPGAGEDEAFQRASARQVFEQNEW